MVKRLAASPHDPLRITDSACKNQSVMVSVQYDPFNTNIPIRSTTIESVSDIAANEEQMLHWAETDSLQTVVQRRVCVIAKYREMLLRKLLEARNNNFESGTPTIAIDLQVLDLLSEAHRLALATLVEQMRQHKLTWTRPSFSNLRMVSIAGAWIVIAGADKWVRECSSTTPNERTQLLQEPAVATLAPICFLVEPVQDLDSRPPFSGRWGWIQVCRDIVQFSLFGHIQPVGTHNLCKDIVAIGLVLDIDADPTVFVGVFRRGPVAIPDFSSSSYISSRAENPSSSSSISSNDSRMFFTNDDIPEISPTDDVLPDEETPANPISLPTAIGAPSLTLGEVKTFPPLNILTVKTVGKYVAKNKNITVDEDEPVETVAKKAATKRRPAPVVAELGRAAPAEKNLAIVTVAQDVEHISVIPATTPKAQRRRLPKRKLVLRDESDDEIVDNIIEQVIKETAEIAEEETNLVEPVVMETIEIETVETESRIDEKEKEKSVAKIIDSEDTEPLSKVLELTEKSTSDEESMSIDDLLAKIPDEMMLPSVSAAEPTKIKFGQGIEIKGVKEGDWYKASLPQIDVADKGKAPLVEKDEIKGHPA
ncbi:hypothetical protein F511_35429 [Dorcoceras hygrometricum]|uniref:Splicing factor 3B subunit 1-like n=1 Tax=Dorcoceras hygrometricum TaxID=472368 RepID=A0A2Z7A660_9LAMI|nr:hypothetical protein F511_35429 [Dorcoceras hygrometricum]